MAKPKVHPIVKLLTPSREQMPAVTAAEKSVVVTAGAGAGKTRTLVARYLFLLDHHGLSPRRIAAITFTRKAAREMRNRVREAIGTYLDGDLPTDEYSRWDLRYSQLDAARIGTIHQLCTEILRSHPAEANVDPRFEVLEDAQAALLQAQAVERALAWAAETERGTGLFELLGERQLREVVEHLLEKRLKTRTAYSGSREQTLARWAEALAEEQAQALNDLLRNPEWHQHVDTLRREVPARRDDRMAEQRALVLAAVDAAATAETLVEKRAALAALDRIDLRGGSQSAWPGGKDQLHSVKGALRGLRLLWRGQAEVQDLALSAVDEVLAASLPALNELFARADRAYDRLKEERQALDFDDLEARALDLLRSDGAVRRRWQEELAAILVDEYQDTNSRQRDLVNLLHGGQNRLFIVGDAKQSIYRFRGAEVAVFREERARIAGGEGAGYKLATTYRPHQALLDELNALLQAIMGTEIDERQPWKEPFTPLTHHREIPRAGTEAPYISLQLAIGKKDEALPAAAQAVAKEIIKLVTDEKSKITYGDVAILCRASTSFGYYEDVLDEWGIPYVTVAGRGFYQRSEVRDLLNCLRAVLNPTDDLALIGLLRSPVGGYSDIDVYHLRQSQLADSFPSLWAYLKRDGAGPAPIALVEGLHEQAGRKPVADLLKSLLDESDYRAALRRVEQQRAMRNVEKLLTLAHDSGLVAVSEFLEYIERVSAVSAREGEARATAGNAVQIMSVHQAKGLEFPVVVIGDVNKSTGGRTDLFVREDWGILPRIQGDEEQEPVAFRLAKKEEEAKEAAEAQRLLYVAATRAEDRLILNGAVQLTSSGRLGWLSGWLKELADPLGLKEAAQGIEDTGAQAISRRLKVGEVTLGCTFYEPDYRPEREPGSVRDQNARRRQWKTPLLDPIESQAADVDDRPVHRVWRVVPDKGQERRAPSRLIGSLVHEALAAWRFPAGYGDGEFETWLRQRAREYGLMEKGQIMHAVNRTVALLDRFRRHSLYQEMNGARRFHEVPYTLAGEAGLERGTVDVLYERDGEWQVVEFKTDRIWGRQAPGHRLVREHYEVQVRRYGQAIARLLGKQPACALCLLDYEGEVRVHPVPLRSSRN